MNIVFARNKAHSMINELFAVTRIVRFSFKASAGFQNTMLFIADSTELPSRRAGGAAGTPNKYFPESQLILTSEKYARFL